jgi:hypothetical protein
MWSAHDMYPGQYLSEHQIVFSNAGSISASAFRIATSNTDPDLARHIEIRTLWYGDGSWNWHNLLDRTQPVHVADVDHDGKLTLADMEAAPLEGLPFPNALGVLSMAFKFSSSAGNETQNRSDTATFRFTLQQ